MKLKHETRFSAEAYRDSYTPDTKGEQLAERRRNLAQLFQQENLIYQVFILVT